MTHRVLLADDSVTIRKVVELTFSDEDFQITSVGDGAQALERAREQRPDIVISDVGMPVLDGYALCERMKADDNLRSVPFLLLRGTFESFDEERARLCGADGILVKPFEAQEMVRKVKELIAAGAAARTPAPVVEAALPIEPPATPRVVPAAPLPRAAAPAARPAPPPPAVPAPQVAAAATAAAALRPAPPPPVRHAAPPAAGAPGAPTQLSAPPPPPPPPRPLTVPSGQASPFAEEDFDLGPVAPEPPSVGGPDDDLWSEVNLRGGSAPIIDPAVGEDTLWGSLADTSVLEEHPAASPAVTHVAPREVWPRFEPAAPPPAAREAAPPAVAPALDQAELERLVAARVDAAVRQALEPLVAGLARPLLEDVAWQVVPELAEAMIRAEIERVTRGTDSG